MSRVNALLKKIPMKKVAQDAALSGGKGVRLNQVHQALRFAFEKAGFSFEIRHRGESQIGLWRLPLTRKNRRTKEKRRFVFVPGFGDTPLSWLPVLAPLSAVLAFRYDELVCLDFPGFGGALSQEPAFGSMDEMREMFREVMATLKPETLMGHSLGGWLCADYVCETLEASQPKQLILADPSGMIGDAEAQALWKKRFETALDQGFSVLRPHVFGKEPFWFKWLVGEFSGFLSSPEIRSFVSSIRDEHLVEKRAEKIRSEVSLIWGEIDSLTPTEWIRVWQKYLSTEKTKPHSYVIRDAGHSIQIEKPGVTLAVVTQIVLGKSAPRVLSNRFWKES